MSALKAIWLVSLALATLALAAVTVLVVVRVLRQRQVKRRAEMRDELESVLRHLIGRPDALGAHYRDLGFFGHGFTSVAVELLNQVDGVTRDRLVELMAAQKTDIRLRKALGRFNQSKRIAAAEALRFFPGARNGLALRRALADRDGEVRIAAAASLIALDDAPPLQELIAQLTRRGQMPVRLGQILRDYCVERPEEVVAVVRDKAIHPFVRAKAVETLAATGDPRYVSVIQGLVLAGEPDLRAAALRAFGKLPNQRSRDAIAMCLRDASWFVRAAAVDAAGQLSLYELVPFITPLVDDEEWWVRFRAGEALEMLDVAGRTALREMAAVGSDRQRRAAALSLSKSEIA